MLFPFGFKIVCMTNAYVTFKWYCFHIIASETFILGERAHIRNPISAVENIVESILAVLSEISQADHYTATLQFQGMNLRWM